MPRFAHYFLLLSLVAATMGGVADGQDIRVRGGGTFVSPGSFTSTSSNYVESMQGDYVSTVYMIQSGHAVTITGGGASLSIDGDTSYGASAQLFISDTGKLSVQSGASVNLANSRSVLSNYGEVEFTGVAIANAGEIQNYGHIYFGNGTTYAAAGSGILKTQSSNASYTIDGQNSAYNLNSIVSAINGGLSYSARSVSNITVTNEISAGGNIDFRDLYYGTVVVQDHQTDYAGSIRVGTADLVIGNGDSSGGTSRFSGVIESGKLTVRSSAELSGTLSTSSLTVTDGATVTLNAGLTMTGVQNIFIDSPSSFVANRNITNASIANNGTFVNNATTTISSGRSYSGSGAITNNGTFVFDQNASYSGTGSFNNANGTLEFNAGMANSGTLVNSLAPNIGTVVMHGSLSDMGTDININATGGTLKLVDQSLDRNRSITIGAADLEIAAGEYKNVTAANITVNGQTSFYGAVRGNLSATDNTVLFYDGASFSGGDLRIAGGGLLYNNAGATITIATGKTLQSGSTFYNRGILNVEAGATYVSSGAVDNSLGTINLNTGANNVMALFDNIAGSNFGTVTITGHVGSNIVKTGATGGSLTLATQQSGNHNIDIGSAFLNLQGGGAFGTVIAGTIYAYGVTSFSGPVTGGLYVQSGTTTLASGQSNGHLVVNTGATLNNSAGSTISVAGNNVSNSGSIVNSGTIATTAASRYSGAGTIDNSASGARLELNAGMSGFDAMMHAVDPNNLGVIDVAGSINAALDIDALAGTVTLTTSQATHNAASINLGAANLHMAGGTFAGAVTAANIESTENVVFRNMVQGNLIAQQQVHFNGVNSGFGGGDLTFNGPLSNSGGTIAIGSGRTFTNANNSTVTNTGTLLFLNGASYVGNAPIVNTGGYLGVHTGAAGYADILRDLDTAQDIGTVNISGTLTGNININAVVGGTVQLASANMNNRDVDVNQAKLVVLGSGQLHDVTALGGVEVNNIANFTGTMNTPELVLAKLPGSTNTPIATFEAGGEFRSGNITVDASTMLINRQGDIEIAGGNRVVNNGAIYNSQLGANIGEFTFAQNAQYSGAGSFNNSTGVLNVHAGMAGFGTLITNLASNDAGTVNISGVISGGLQSSATYGMFNLNDAQGAVNAAIDINQATLNVNNGGTFTGGTTAGTIVVANQDAAFGGRVALMGTGADSALTAGDGVTVTLLPTSVVDGGLTGIGSGGFLLQSGGQVAVTEGKKLQLENGVFDNSGSLVFAKNADFALSGSGAVQNRAGSSVDADLAMPTIGALLGASHMATGSTLNLVNSQETATLTSSLTIGSANAGSTINIDGDLMGLGTGKVVLSGAALNFGQANVNYNRGILDLRNGGIVAGGSFRTAAGTSLIANTAGGSTSTITAANSYIASSVDLGKADRVLFDGNVTFSGDIVFTIDADDTLFANGGKAGNIAATGDLAFDAGGAYAIDFVNAALDGSNLAGKPLFEVNDGQTISNSALLQSTMYNLVYRDNKVYVQDQKAIDTVLSTLFDPDRINKNKISLARYLTELPGHISQDLSVRLGNYFRTGAFDERNGYLALGQMVGEYGAYADTGLLRANDLYFRSIFDRMNQRIDKAWQRCGQTSLYDADSHDFASDGGAFWGGYLGSHAEQRGENHISGYDFTGNGMILGYDRRFGRLDVGFAGSYLPGRVDVGEMAAAINSDLVNFGAYGSYISSFGPIVKAGLGYGMGENDYKVNMVIGGPKFGKYDNSSLSAYGEIGYPLCLFETMDLTPSIGANYVNYRHKGWTETFDSREASPISVANWFAKGSRDRWEIPVGARLSRTIDFYGHLFAAELRGIWIQSYGSREPTVTTGFVGAGIGTPVWGVQESRDRMLLGASLRSNLSDRLFANLSYDFEMRKQYRNHSLVVNLEAVF